MSLRSSARYVQKGARNSVQLRDTADFMFFKDQGDIEYPFVKGRSCKVLFFTHMEIRCTRGKRRPAPPNLIAKLGQATTEQFILGNWKLRASSRSRLVRPQPHKTKKSVRNKFCLTMRLKKNTPSYIVNLATINLQKKTFIFCFSCPVRPVLQPLVQTWNHAFLRSATVYNIGSPRPILMRCMIDLYEV